MRKSQLETAIQVTARLLIEGQERAEREATRLRIAAKQQGHTIDTRVQYAEGSAAAYAMASAILTGACMAPNIDYLAGSDWKTLDVLPPILAHDDDGFPGTTVSPDDRIAAATVKHAIDVDVIDERDGGRNDR